MRTLTTALATLLASAGVRTLPAQHAHQFELGAFGSYTRYDRAFGLDNQFGGGARVGYFFGRVVGAELDIGYVEPNATSGVVTAELTHGSGSLVLNVAAGERHLLYILGGYTRLDFEKTPPYRFTDNAVHGALGDRVFLGSRAALRLEVRAIYAPSTHASFASGWAGHVVGSLGLSVFAGGGPPSDADGDGVPDGRDACPSTPHGATVDAAGCPLDADKDGVPDGLDQCPGTPSGARVDAKGCPADGDGDGVPDGVDQCPNTPAGAVVDAAGCPLDGDKDGVPDGLDKCPNTPPGTAVDAVGCTRVADSDGDGVDDTKDKCPGTAPGTRVDASGCPILFTPERTPVILRGVTFETGRSALKLESHTVLDIVAQSLLDNPDIRIEIAGYTDTTGAPAANLRLSQARAAAVRAYLAARGVAPGRMVARGYGAANPIAPNKTLDGRAQNRRVELHQLP